METTEFENNLSLNKVLSDFVQSYVQRDTDMAFSDWLAGKLRQELPDMEPEASIRLANDIIEAVASYDQTLHELNQAVEDGQSKEDWFSEQLEDVFDGMAADAGRMETEPSSPNRQGERETGVPDADEAESDAGKYRIKDTINHIGRQFYSVALFAAANALEKKVNGERVPVIEIIADAFRKGMNTTPDEVKAVVATAVQVSVEKGLTDILPADTPTEVIACFAGIAVECVEALCDAANEAITLTEAMDRLGRAAFAAGCRIGAGFLRGKIKSLPGDHALVDLLSVLLDYMGNPQAMNKLYAHVRRVAATVREGVKQSDVAKRLNQLRQKLFA